MKNDKISYLNILISNIIYYLISCHLTNSLSRNIRIGERAAVMMMHHEVSMS